MRGTRLSWAIGALVLLGALASPSNAATFRAGRLLCFSSPRVGLVFGSSQSLRCVFNSLRPAKQYIYEGRIQRVGFDLGATSAGSLSWAVLAKGSPRIGAVSLRGTYVGASAKVAFGPGFGANVLIGGSRRNIMLQPLSVERAIGINLAASVTNLMLARRGTP